jgi:hypothetical protein
MAAISTSNCQYLWFRCCEVLLAWPRGPHGDLDVAIAVPGDLGHAEPLVESLGTVVDGEHVEDQVLALCQASSMSALTRRVPMP